MVERTNIVDQFGRTVLKLSNIVDWPSRSLGYESCTADWSVDSKSSRADAVSCVADWYGYSC